MPLDKFINTVRIDVAKSFNLKTDAEIDAFFIGLEESAKDNQESLEKRDKMLRDTVAELCEAKRLLKLAVEDITFILSYTCSDEEMCCKECPTENHACNKWRYADEALKLIGDETDEKPRQIHTQSQ